MLETLGGVSLFFMGGLLGLMGAGGSILTIPILVYLLGISMSLATTYSLVIVGVSSFAAVVGKRHAIRFTQAAFFIFPSFFGVTLSRYFLLPYLIDAMDQGALEAVLLGLLITLMVAAGHVMMSNPTVSPDHVHVPSPPLNVIFTALMVGVIMGLLGVGGGFVIIPSLVLMLGFTIEQAIPTSLFIIMLNSLAGFAVDHHELSMTQWKSLIVYLILSLFGMFVGTFLSQFIKGENLKKGFGYFIWVIAIMILVQEWW